MPVESPGMDENILLMLHGSFAEAGGIELRLPERHDAPRQIALS